MIVKKIENPRKTSSKTERINKLSDYIIAPERANASEKCIYANARGFLTDTHAGRKSEMVALAQEAVRSPDTINHYLLSWQAGEQPTNGHVENAVSIFLNELGLKDHQVIYGLHSDTDNKHVHIEVNRVHPDSLKVIKPNKGFDKEAAHKAIARIEHVQGWQREKNGRYWVLENGDLAREHLDPDKPQQPPSYVTDRENRIGEKSAVRIAIEIATPIFKVAKNWQALHEALARVGMRYEKTDRGGTVGVGDIDVKAGSVLRSASLPKLQQKYGPYEQPVGNHHDPQNTVEIGLKPYPKTPVKEMAGWREYSDTRKTYDAEKRPATVEQKHQHQQEQNRLLEQQKVDRMQMLSGSWQGKGDLLNALRSIIAAEQAVEKVSLKERQQRERDQLRKKYPPFLGFEDWLRSQHCPDLADVWRYRASEPHVIEGDGTELATLREITHYTAVIYNDAVHYTRNEVKAGQGSVAFIDRGSRIDIYDGHNRDCILAALQVSQQKWDSFHITGSNGYITLCVKIAAEHGFKLSNAELQDVIEQERNRIQDERQVLAKPAHLKMFEQYHESVGADRYRVTHANRPLYDNRTFILGGKQGLDGLKAAEIVQLTPEMTRQSQRGENLYYLPISDHTHHVVVDDISKEKLVKLVKDGYQPALVLENSPGDFQVIINVPKLGTIHDTEVINQIAARLHQEYSTRQWKGGVYPHLAPGYEHQKWMSDEAHFGYRTEAGYFPKITRLKVQRQECTKLLELSKNLTTDSEAKAQGQYEFINLGVTDGAAADETVGIAIYLVHYHDMATCQPIGNLNLVDMMIAIRMRVCGHDPGFISGAIHAGGRAIRTTEQVAQHRDWQRYVDGVADYAFSAAGNRQVEQLETYTDIWRVLENTEKMQIEQPQQDETDFGMNF